MTHLEPPLLQTSIPSQIGRYEVIAQLGAGGMARVYLALQRGPFASATKLLVVKHLRPEVASDSHFLAMFADEARIALRLNHPNVVHTYEVVAEEGQLFLVMEFLEGQSLTQLLARAGRESFPTDTHLWILTQVLAGLHHAHTLHDFDGSPLEIVHRDVTPSNVFITYAGEVKLVDFGIAKASGSVAETQQGMIKGKLGYVAPEQCIGKTVDARSDLYAVGVMLWEALAGRRRMFGDTAAALLQARVRNEEPPIEEVCPEVPGVLAQITGKALATDANDRYASAQEFQAALESYLSGQPVPAGQPALSALMKLHFHDEMVSLRRLIDEHVGTSRRTAPLDLADNEIVTLQDRSGVNRTPITAFGKTDAPPTAGPNHNLRLGVAGAVIVGMVAALSLRALKQSSTASAPVSNSAAMSSAPALAVTPSVQPAPVTTSAPLAPPIDKIHLNVSVVPKQAIVRIDGVLLTTPFSGAWPKSDAAHVLSVDAVGYLSEKRALVFDRDIDLELRMKPGKALPNAATPASPQAKQSAPPSGEVEPGQDLRVRAAPREKASHTIDEKDPYAQ